MSQQVEALFLQMMLKSMRDASAADGELDSNETGMYQDMFDKQVALTLSKHQDLGIARLFERQLGGKARPAAPAAPATPRPRLPKTRPRPPRAHADGRSGRPPDIRCDHGAARGRSSSAPCCRPFAAWPQASASIRWDSWRRPRLETGWGKRMARTADGSPSLNMFGIKAGEGWNGARAVADTVEFSGGVATQRRTAFRAYGSIEESVSDFANLLSSSPRYREAVAAGGNAQAYIHSIARSGYATDPGLRE